MLSAQQTAVGVQYVSVSLSPCVCVCVKWPSVCTIHLSVLPAMNNIPCLFNVNLVQLSVRREASQVPAIARLYTLQTKPGLKRGLARLYPLQASPPLPLFAQFIYLLSIPAFCL